ncbi:hypothetical protein HYV50_05245 [Candidatus Pacearchaeota archaeon]|nr:hypothetical protein [Candidatus Pacearchaeota archaeon]
MEKLEEKCFIGNGAIDKIKKVLKYHFVDSTAALALSTPLFAAVETNPLLAEMPDENSINARLLAAGFVYSGLGYFYGKGRDLWRKKFGITDETRESKQKLHDFIYSAIFTFIVTPPIYFFSGTEQKEILSDNFWAAGVGGVSGIFAGYAIDLFRELVGLEESKRIPELIRKQDSRVKKGLAALLTAGSVCATAGIYQLT